MTSEESRTSRASVFLPLLICGLAVLLGAVRGATIPLWFDEISTLRIAELPTWHAVFHGTQTLDLNPPLEVFLVRISTHLLGPHELAARLPSILGFGLAVGCLFVFL